MKLLPFKAAPRALFSMSQPVKTGWRATLCALIALIMCVAGTARPARAVDWGLNMSSAEYAGSKAQDAQYGNDYTYPNEIPGDTSGLELDYFSNKGLKLVRLPFSWEHMQPTLLGPLDEFNVGKFLTFLQEAKARNMKVLPDCHNYGEYYVKDGVLGVLESENPSLYIPRADLGDLWAKLIGRVRDAGLTDVIYGWDIMNEPRDLGVGRSNSDQAGIDRWFNIAQSTVTAIRSVPNMPRSIPVFVAGYQYSPARAWTQYSNNLYQINDPDNNLVFEAHNYWDSDGSGTYRAGGTFNAETGNSANKGADQLSNFFQWLKDHGKKGYVGEFSINTRQDNALWAQSLNQFISKISNAQNDYGITIVGATYWASSIYDIFYYDQASNRYLQNGSPLDDLEPIHSYSNLNVSSWTDSPAMVDYLGAINGYGGTSTQNFGTAYYKIISRNSPSGTQKGLDVDNTNGNAGNDLAKVQQYDYLGTSNQQWQLLPTDSGYFKIVSRLSGKGLDAENNRTQDNGTQVQIYTYLGGLNQQWQVVPTDSGYFKILERRSGAAIDVNYASQANGATVQLYQYGGGLNQQWQIVLVDAGTADPSNLSAQ